LIFNGPSGIFTKMPRMPQFVVVVILSCGCQVKDATGPSKSPASTLPTNVAEPISSDSPPSGWTKHDALPLLAAKRLRPIAEVENFRDRSSFRYPREPDVRPPEEEPFDDDKDAIAAATAWIVAHFGQLPPHTSLEVRELNHSSSGREMPAFDWDRGHTVSFRQHFHGIPTDQYAVVYITGKTRFSASVSLSSFDSVPDSGKPIVSEGAAIKAWRDIYENQDDRELLEEFDKTARARLV
jgi:hypothetical protein